MGLSIETKTTYVCDAQGCKESALEFSDGDPRSCGFVQSEYRRGEVRTRVVLCPEHDKQLYSTLVGKFGFEK